MPTLVFDRNYSLRPNFLEHYLNNNNNFQVYPTVGTSFGMFSVLLLTILYNCFFLFFSTRSSVVYHSQLVKLYRARGLAAHCYTSRVY